MRVCLKSLPECSKSASLTSKTFCIQSTCPEPGPSFLEVTTVMMMMLENQYVRETWGWGTVREASLRATGQGTCFVKTWKTSAQRKERGPLCGGLVVEEAVGMRYRTKGKEGQVSHKAGEGGRASHAKPCRPGGKCELYSWPGKKLPELKVLCSPFVRRDWKVNALPPCPIQLIIYKNMKYTAPRIFGFP